MARTSSAASGLRFCGMIELPVVKASLSSTKLNGVAAPDHDLLGKARQMHAGERGGGEKFDREIAVGDGVERIGGGPVEAERRGGCIAVDRERGAGERRGAERQLVHSAPAIGEPAAVAADHLDIGHQMMAEGHRLGDLQMGEARHHRVAPASSARSISAPCKSRIAASMRSIAARTHS